MAARKGFEDFEPVFGEASPEWDSSASSAVPLRRFLFSAQSLDASRLEVIATDFHSLTFARAFTVFELEDLRDDIGIGGSWPEFVDYLRSSYSSVDVKLTLIPGAASGSSHANLVAVKSKGLPRISLSLDKVGDMQASDAMAKLSLALFEVFRNKDKAAIKEQEHSSRLVGILSSEREKNANLQQQLDSLSFLSKRKVPKAKSLDNKSTGSNSLEIYEKTLVSEIQQPSDISTIKEPQVNKRTHRAAPVSRRAKVRGASLQDISDGDDD